MTVSIRRMSLGTGFKYLMGSVAAGDGVADLSSPLTRYYAESGTPPGRFCGAGLAGVNDGQGVAEGSEVTEDMLFNMLGLCADPITGLPLGRGANRWPKPLAQRIADRVGRLPDTLDVDERAWRIAIIDTDETEREAHLVRPVAGFDLTFSAPKSISAAWALADAGTQAVIYAAHQDAIRITLAYAESHVFASRSGTNGVVHETIRGVVAAAFDHWDSRAGDPQLHTHTVVLNRAQSHDGTWRTLDSRAIFKSTVALSELHTGVLFDLLAVRLGWGFDPRRRRHSTVPKHEVTGVADELIAEFSQRSAQIETAKNQLVEAFVTAHGRQPTATEVLRLRQRATLATRPEKRHHSLAEHTDLWRARAQPFVGGDPVAWVGELAGRSELPLLRADDLADPMLADLAAVVTWTVAGKRATFSRANILAETHRQLHGVRFADPADRIAVADRTADLALADAVLVTAPEAHHVPALFTRPAGRSLFRIPGAALYTTWHLLDAEARLLAAGRDTTGPTADRGVVAAVCEANLPGKTYPLSGDQALAVEQIATSGRVLDVLVGPAGTGKSTSMAGLRAVWETQHAPGTILGLAPSAAAADVLAAELGIDTDNTAKWLTETARQPERTAALARLAERIAAHRRRGLPTGMLRQRLTRLQAEHDRWRLRPGQLVIVDEASLAGTFALDQLVTQARDAQAKVLLVGDWAQLSAVEAGGAFDLLVRDRDLVAELTDVRRFRHGWEKTASIGLRIGDTDALDVYAAHERIVGVGRDELLDTLYEAWRADVADGKQSLMIAGDTDTVSELNARARADRVAAGEVSDVSLAVAGGAAGVGDRVVTRLNNRHLSAGSRWVKNGDAWTVTRLHRDGSMTVRRDGKPITARLRRRAGEVVLPADYVREHVELGYACTAHRAQGRTVDTARALVNATTAREVLYVAATRGRDANQLYVDTLYDPDPATSHGPGQPRPPLDVLRGVLANVGADLAAHTRIALEHDTARSVATLAAEYLTIARAAQAQRFDALLDHAGLTPEEAAQVRESDAYGPLVASFRDADARGLDVAGTLPRLVARRERDSADDLAAVLHYRVGRWIEAAGGRRPAVSRLIAGLIPAAVGVTDPDLQRALAERAVAIEHRARERAARALAEREPWTRQLGTPPRDPGRRETWQREVATVAAYRDRWNITSRQPIPPTPATVEQIGHAKRATAALARAAQLGGAHAAQTSAAATERGSEIETGPAL